MQGDDGVCTFQSSIGDHAGCSAYPFFIEIFLRGLKEQSDLPRQLRLPQQSGDA
jgi:hypothetical protein